MSALHCAQATSSGRRKPKLSFNHQGSAEAQALVGGNQHESDPSSGTDVRQRRRARQHHRQARDRPEGSDPDRLSAGAHRSLVVHRRSASTAASRWRCRRSMRPAAIDGRQIELISRDTQSDPTKAVNGAAELTRGAKVQVVFGPVNSGEALAVGAAARARQRTAAASLLGRLACRREEISAVLPQRADQPADRRRRQPLRRGGAQEARRSR